MSTNTWSAASERKCYYCRQDKQKCDWLEGQAKCERCEKLNYTCALDNIPAAADTARRTLRFEKCSFCRQARQKCLPVDRIFPARCDRCIAKGLACSEPQKKSREPPSRASGAFTAQIPLHAEPPEPRFLEATKSTKKRQRLQPSGLYRETAHERELTSSDLGYKPLESSKFRILELHRGLEGDDIVFELHDWDGLTQYEAVSYERSFKQGVPITMLDPRIKRRTRTIMPNIHAALNTLRYRDRSRYLWINALCINHGDVAERNLQAHVVRDIFSRASNVRLWLGKTDGALDDDIALAFQFAKHLLAPKFFDDAAKDVALTTKWKALVDLLSHPLFERRWVVQEVAVSQQATLQCGHHMMAWSEFADVVTMFEHAEKSIHSISQLFKRSTEFSRHSNVIGDAQALGASRFVNLTSNIFRKSRTATSLGESSESLLDLEELVLHLASFQGWDLHDVIYACVSLSQESYGFVFATYEPSLNVRKAADKFLGLLHPKVNWDEKPAILRPRKLNTVGKAAAALLRRESSNLDSRREIDSFVGQRGCHQNDRMPYNVNYDLPVLVTYQEFIAHVMRKSKSLGILCRPWAPPKKALAGHIDGRIPSWLATLDRAALGRSPTFASYVRINADPLIGPLAREPYNASLGLPASWAFRTAQSGNHRLLLVDGFVLTAISETRTEALGGNIPLKWAHLVGWERHGVVPKMIRDPDTDVEILLRTTTEEPPHTFDSGNELPPDNLWRTLVADRGPNGSYAPVFYRRACQYAFRESGVASVINTNELLESVELSMVREFLNRVQEVVWNRQLIMTKRGCLGLAPEAAMKGDLICILYGCSVPVVIRELEDGNHEFVGECYVHGMMDGAAMSIQIAEQIPKMTFNLF